MGVTQELQVKLFLLGRFEVAYAGQLLSADAWPRKKAAALMKRLAHDQRLLKDQAIEFLWPETDFTSASNSLYNTVSSLRKTIDTAFGNAAANTVFRFEKGILTLAPSAWVDVREFEQLSNVQTADTAEQRIANLEQALEIYRGDLLPDDAYEDWTLLPRQALNQRQREVRIALASYRRDTLDYAGAIQLLTPLLAHDLLDEPVHRELMRLYTLSGQRHEALRQYQTCVDSLAKELDVPPSPETAALYAQILSGKLSPPPSTVQTLWTPPKPVLLEMTRSTPMIGRSEELDLLRNRLHLDLQQPGRTILITGESGVGKTRLAYESLHSAAANGMITLLGAAYEQEGRPAYQPFVEAIDRYLSDHHRPLDENPISANRQRVSGDSQQKQLALFNSTAAFLTSLAATLPVVLLVDDLHAADEASLHLFHYLARQTRSSSVVLLATYRNDLGEIATPSFSRLLNALYREHLSETVTLESLEMAASDKVMTHILSGTVAPELGRAVYEITLGNPFFVEEITRDLLKSNMVTNQGGIWQLRTGYELHIPADLASLMRERVHRLGSSVEDLLSAAAVIGREFRFDILRSISGLTQNVLLDALDAALAGNLFEETAEGYRFHHPLTRRVFYNALSRARRAQLHGQCAAAIEVIHAQQSKSLDLYVEDLAFHYDLSDRRDRALEYLVLAGKKAARVYAFEVAVGYYERALDLMNALNLTESARRWMILESLGWWHIILANTPGGVARFEQALSLQPENGWQSSRADRARLHRGAAVALITVGDTASAEEHLTTALAEIDETEDAAEFAQVLYNIAQLHWHRNEYRDAFKVAQRSLAIAERLNDPTAIARAFEMLALACHSLGEWQNGIGYEQQRIAFSGPGLDVTEAFDVHL